MYKEFLEKRIADINDTITKQQAAYQQIYNQLVALDGAKQEATFYLAKLNEDPKVDDSPVISD